MTKLYNCTCSEFWECEKDWCSKWTLVYTSLMWFVKVVTVFSSTIHAYCFLDHSGFVVWVMGKNIETYKSMNGQSCEYLRISQVALFCVIWCKK